MDAQTFDHLTRRLRTSLSRRRLGLAGAGFLALVGGPEVEEAAARRRCRLPAVKCRKDCCRGRQVCRNGKCRTCRGVRCPDGRCLTESCGGVCCDEGVECCDEVCCAAGETCSSGGTCTPCQTLTDSCEGVETQCTVDEVTGRCATSNQGGNYCVEYDFPCVACTSDAECTTLVGQAAICISCEGCQGSAGGLGCARVLALA